MENKFIAILLTALVVAMAPYAALAKTGLAYPHNFDCSNRHNTQQSLGTTGYNNVCTSCHNLTNKGKNKPFEAKDAANPYGTITSARTIVYQTSHNWTGPDVNPNAGALAPTSSYMYTSNISGSLLCARCHNVHGFYSSATVSKPFLRMRNDNNEMCLDCHRTRDKQSQQYGTHPVNINYSTAKLTGNYNTAPVNTNPSNPTSAMQLVNGKILCTTCHGVHYTDSRSGSYQNHSSFAKLSTSKGMLLRTNARGKTANDPNICTNCHTSKVNHNYKDQNIQCNDCHSGHVEYDKNAVTPDEKEPNKFLIRRYMNVSTAFGKFTSIRTFYRYTSAAKKEFFLGGDKTQNTKVGVGICQACHNNTSAFKLEHYSSSGTTGLKNNHTDCESCHSHKSPSGSFSCGSCHGMPPSINAKGMGGYGVWSTTTNPTHRGYSSHSGRVDESRSPHATHADGRLYTFACMQCHNNNTHNNGNFRQVFPGQIGSKTVIIAGVNAQYSTAGNRYRCLNVYCHSNGQITSYADLDWKNGMGTITTNNTNRCESCHGDKKGPWTITAGKPKPLSGAHQIHASTAGVNYACQNCHAGTLTAYATFDNNSALIYPSKNHVNGVKDVIYSFPRNNGLNNNVSGTTYAQDQTCATIYCHSNGAGKPGNSVPTWNDPNSGKCGACHKVLATTETGTNLTRFGVISSNAHFEHLSSVYGPKLQSKLVPNACIACHNSFVSELTHVDGVKTPDTSAGTACQKCHGDPRQGSPIWTKNARIACTQCHPIWAKYSAARLPAGMWPSGEAAPTQFNYSTSGHGKRKAPFNKQIECNDCHNPNSSHISTTGQLGVYQRLATFSNFTGKRLGNNAVCNSCHWGGQSAQNKIMFGHVTSVSEARKGTPTMACSKCHDVHGSSNDHMIRTTFVFKPRSSAYIAYSSPYFNIYSSPNSTVVKSKVAKTGNFKFIDPSSNKGICQVCHTNTMHFRRGRNEAVSGPVGGSANPNIPTATIVSHRNMNQSTNCLLCHAHNPPPTSSGNYAFYPFGKCDVCHGYPPVPRSWNIVHNNYSSGKFQDYTGGGGSHVFAGHIPPSANPAQSWDNCNSCHSESDHLSVSGYAQVKVTINPAYRFYSAPGVMAKYTSNRLDSSAHITGTCNNVSCHFQKTPKWGKP